MFHRTSFKFYLRHNMLKGSNSFFVLMLSRKRTTISYSSGRNIRYLNVFADQRICVIRSTLTYPGKSVSRRKFKGTRERATRSIDIPLRKRDFHQTCLATCYN